MRSAAKSAAFGGVLLAMIEGLGILLTRATAPPPAPPMMDMAPMGAPLPQAGAWPETLATPSTMPLPHTLLPGLLPRVGSSRLGRHPFKHPAGCTFVGPSRAYAHLW